MTYPSEFPIRCSRSSDQPKIILLLCLVVIWVSFTWSVVNIVGYNLTAVSIEIVPLGPVGVWGYMQSWPVTINVRHSLLDPPIIWASLQLLISDFIVTWRAWILLQNARFWRFVLMSFMVACIGPWQLYKSSHLISQLILSSGINIVDCIVQVLMSSSSFINRLGFEEFMRLSDSSLPLDLYSVVTSLVLDVCATLLVLWRAW